LGACFAFRIEGRQFGDFFFFCMLTIRVFLISHHPPPPGAAYGTTLARYLPKE